MTYCGRVIDGVVVFDPAGALPDGTEVRVEPVPDQSAGGQPRELKFDAGAFWASPSFEELAAVQQVTVPQSFDEIVGGWPEDEIDDGFERALVTWRQSDGEHRG